MPYGRSHHCSTVPGRGPEAFGLTMVKAHRHETPVPPFPPHRAGQLDGSSAAEVPRDSGTIRAPSRIVPGMADGW